MKHYCPSISEFLETITERRLTVKQREYFLKLKGMTLENDILQFYTRLDLEEEEKIEYINRVHGSINLILSMVEDDSVEKKYLNKLEKIILTHSRISIRKDIVFNEIFKSKEAYEHFINTLNMLNILDSQNEAKRGFQAAASAMFTSKNFKQYIFIENLKLREFIVFLNKYLNAKIKAKDRLSDGSNYILAIEEYFKNYLV